MGGRRGAGKGDREREREGGGRRGEGGGKGKSRRKKGRGKWGEEHLREGPLPSLTCWSLSVKGLCLCSPHLQAGLIVWGPGPFCVGQGTSLAGHRFVIICSLALIGCMRRELSRALGHRS